MHACMKATTDGCMYGFMYGRICARAYVCLYAYTHICAYIHICTYVRVYVPTYVGS